MQTYIEALTEYANGIVDSDFPSAHVDDGTRELVRKLVLGIYGNDAERLAGKYTGFGSFGNALKDRDWQEAAFRADSQNVALLSYWMKLDHWLARKSEDIVRFAEAGDDGIRFIREGH